MGRKVAVAWHASFSIVAGVLYFFFVLPRWPELMGTTSHTLGTVLRIVTGAADRPGRTPGGLHAAAHPQARAGHPAAGAQPADGVDRAARAGGRADRRRCDQRDLAQPGQRRALALRHLRCRRGDRTARHLRVLPGIRGGDAAASAQTAQAEGGEEKPSRPPQGRGRCRRGQRRRRRTPSRKQTRPPLPTTSRPSAEAPAESEEQPSQEPAEVTAETSKDDDADAVETDDSDAVNGSENTNGGLRNRRAGGKISLRKRRRSRGGVAVDD